MAITRETQNVDLKKVGQNYNPYDADKSRAAVTRTAINTSGLEPLGFAVLVEPYEPEINKSALVIPDNVRGNTAAVETRAVVIEVGPEAWRDESAPRARPGDKVLISRFAGVLAIGVADGKRYRIVNDRDIFTRIKE